MPVVLFLNSILDYCMFVGVCVCLFVVCVYCAVVCVCVSVCECEMCECVMCGVWLGSCTRCPFSPEDNDILINAHLTRSYPLPCSVTSPLTLHRSTSWITTVSKKATSSGMRHRQRQMLASRRRSNV